MKRILMFCGILLLTMFLLTGCGGSKIDIADYIDVTFTGANGYATASTRFNSSAFEEDMMSLMSKQNHSDMSDLLLRLLMIESAIDYQLDKTTELSNGESITLTTTYNGNYTDSFKIKLIAGSKHIKIEDLPELPELSLSKEDIASAIEGEHLNSYFDDARRYDIRAADVVDATASDTSLDYSECSASAAFTATVKNDLIEAQVNGDLYHLFDNDTSSWNLQRTSCQQTSIILRLQNSYETTIKTLVRQDLFQYDYVECKVQLEFEAPNADGVQIVKSTWSPIDESGLEPVDMEGRLKQTNGDALVEFDREPYNAYGFGLSNYSIRLNPDFQNNCFVISGGNALSPIN